MKKALMDLSMNEAARESFLRLFQRYREGPARVIHWESIRSPDPDNLLSYDALPVPEPPVRREELGKLAVCKLNGGLGTTMGCRGPKSAIVVRDGKSFMDLTVEQLCECREDDGLPLILMNSFYTHEDTEKTIKKYQGLLEIISFQQNKFPRIHKGSETPLSEKEFGLDAWYPPGHGEFYSCLAEQGILDRLLENGKEILFVSNADNLGAVVDERILHYMLGNDVPFLMEMTPKTPADVKGGTLYQEGDRLKLLEVAQVPAGHMEEFCGQEKFKVFNTNNIWINLRHLKKKLAEGPLELDVIVNRKTVGGCEVIQLETAIGAALEKFPGAVGLTVSRDRFLSVKKTDDLLLIQSDLFILEGGRLRCNPERKLSGLPRVRLGKNFSHLDEYVSRIPIPPRILELKSLELDGDVRFDGEVTLKGTVRLVHHGETLHIPAQSVLEDKVIES